MPLTFLSGTYEFCITVTLHCLDVMVLVVRQFECSADSDL